MSNIRRKSADVLEAIGNTPLVKLRKVVPENCADVYVKLEYYNPTGSKKDRMALAMIEAAEESGDLKPGMKVVEMSGGSTGAGLALVCAAKGYDFHVVSSDAFSKEKLDMMAALGAEVDVIESHGGGITLELLEKMEFEITGFDPAYEGSNINIVKAPFEQKSHLKAEGIILRHVLEHIKNPYDFLTNISLANNEKGKIYIEVPCFDWILNNNAWYDIFYEHVNYFRLSDLKNMFSKVYDSGKLFGDQYIYIVADLASLKEPVYNKNNSVKFPKNFTKQIDQVSLDKDLSKNLFVWGGGSKGAIFTLLKRRSGLKIDGIVDINPAKQGKYIPAVGEKVISPEQAAKKFPEGSNCYVMNSNYLNEIKNISRNKYNYITID